MEPIFARRGNNGMRTHLARNIVMLTALLLGPAVASTAKTAGEYTSASNRSTEEISVPGNGSWKVSIKEQKTNIERKTPTGAWKKTLDAQFRVPIVTTRGMRAGPSSDGSTLALVASSSGTSADTRFIVVTQSTTTNITLPGQWTFDAISPNGRTLYLAQSVGGDTYVIRPVDVATGRAGVALKVKSVTVDRNGQVDDGPTMEGLPIERITSQQHAFILTLYDGPGFPFVHALQARDSFTLCYDLPGSMKSIVNELTLRSTTDATTFNVVHKGKVMATLTLPMGSSGPSLRMANDPPGTTIGS